MRRIEIRKRGGGGGDRREDPSKEGKKRREGERGFFNLFCLCYELGERVRPGGGGRWVVCFQSRYASGGQRGKQCERLAPAEGKKTHIRAAGLQ